MPGGAEWLIILAIIIAALVFWIKSIVEIAGSTFEDPNMKIVWLLIVIFLGLLGAIIYTIAGRKGRIK
jgi:hypothetical protein